MRVRFRAATCEDEPVLRRMIGLAAQWRHADPPPLEAGPDSYVDGFGRAGDLGIVAAVDGLPVGAAWLRFFAEADRRAGFVAEEVPELAIAVDPAHRGDGVGRGLLDRLLARASAHDIHRVSLHVSAENARARVLYDAVGFEPVDVGTKPVVMLREDAARCATRARHEAEH